MSSKKADTCAGARRPQHLRKVFGCVALVAQLAEPSSTASPPSTQSPVTVSLASIVGDDGTDWSDAGLPASTLALRDLVLAHSHSSLTNGVIQGRVRVGFVQRFDGFNEWSKDELGHVVCLVTLSSSGASTFKLSPARDDVTAALVQFSALHEASHCEGFALFPAENRGLFQERFADARAALLLARLLIVQGGKPGVYRAAMDVMQNARETYDANDDHDTSSVLLGAMRLVAGASAKGGTELSSLVGAAGSDDAEVSRVAQRLTMESMARASNTRG